MNIRRCHILNPTALLQTLLPLLSNLLSTLLHTRRHQNPRLPQYRIHHHRNQTLQHQNTRPA
ncbi:hypothetical protein Hanom_Chr06g00530021 [Helianthus anomalus]